MHELKLIVDLFYRGGLNYMRYSVSDTAEHGDYTGGPRVVTDETRAAMRQILAEIQERHLRPQLDRRGQGRPALVHGPAETGAGLIAIEKVGAELRAMMPFLDAVTLKEQA